MVLLPLVLLLLVVGAVCSQQVATANATVALSPPEEKKKRSPPHVVLMVLDDIGWADVGYHGGNFPTPNLDKLAGSGAKLERFYVMPQCSPTRAAVMTGRYSFRTGMQHFSTITPGSTAAIPHDAPTIAETFKAGGYATHMVGKWHLGYSRWSHTPLGRGFDTFYGYLQGQTDYYNRTMPSCGLDDACLYKINKGVDSPLGPTADAYDFWDNREPVYGDFGKYTADAYEERLEKLLTPYGSPSPPSDPLFLYFSEQQLHIPLQAPPEAKYLERCRGVQGGDGQVNRTILCSMASRLDDSVGRLEQLLKKNQMWDNTIILALTDNGGMTQWGDLWPASASSNYPLRGGKTTLFEGGVRAVAFAAGGALPKHARGTHRKQVMHAVDVLPTLASLAGVPVKKAVDGLDVWSAIARGEPISRKEIPLNIGINPLGGFPPFTPGLLADGHLNYSSILAWPWKIMVGDTYISIATKDSRRRDGWWSVDKYEYTEPPDARVMGIRLYNLEEDECEKVNLADKPEHKELVSALYRRVQYYASKESGWVKPQFNLAHPRGNPRFWNWTWAPFKLWAAEHDRPDQHETIVV